MPIVPSARLLPAIALSSAAWLWTGCETAAPTAAARTEAADRSAFPREAVKRLQVGMPQSAVRTLLGEPTEIRQLDGKTGPAEVWVYTNWLDPVYREVAVEVDEVPFVDPITGIERTILDPRQQLERVTRKEYFQLTFDASRRIVDLSYELERARGI